MSGASHRVAVDRPTTGEMELTIHALHGVFWALNLIVSQHAVDEVAHEPAIRCGVDELILAGQLLTEGIRARF